MLGAEIYAGAAITTSGAVVVVAEFLRHADTPATEHLGGLALITGLLWPVVLLGGVEIGFIAALVAMSMRRHRDHPR